MSSAPAAHRQPRDPARLVRDAATLASRSPPGKTSGDWDDAASSIPRPTQDALKTLEWMQRKENLCICGPSGTGKSHFCEALGRAAVEAGCGSPRRISA